VECGNAFLRSKGTISAGVIKKLAGACGNRTHPCALYFKDLQGHW
jgi:hypothetical protein